MRNALLLATILLLVACAHGPRQDATHEAAGHAKAETLVGEWRYADSIQSCHYIFQNDGKFSGEVTYQGRRVSQFSGQWSVRRDRLLYHYTGDVLGRIPAGSKDSDKLLEVASDHFVIEAADGSQRRYRRIK